MTLTFNRVDGKTHTLNDIVPATTGRAPISRNTFYIKFFGDDGAMAKIKTDKTLQDFNETAWAQYGVDPQKELVFYKHTDAHWYLYDDLSHTYQMDDYPLATGRGFYVFALQNLDPGASVTIQSSGEVDKEGYSIDIPKGKRALVGNTAPCQKLLKEFTVDTLGMAGVSRNTFYIKFFGDDGAMAKIKTDKTLEKFNKTAWETFGADAEKELVFYFHTDKHWYLYDDLGHTYKMDDYPIAAGRGMIPQALSNQDVGNRFTVPGVDL